MLEHLTKKNRAHILAFDDTLLNDIEVDQLNTLLNRRLKNEPMAYILGYKEFYGRDFFVDENVLIPRPESELLIDEAIDYFKNIDTNTCLQFCDIGTGSGCLAITSVLEIKNVHCCALDISNDALEIAKENALKNNANEMLKFFHLDILKGSDNSLFEELAFDCIISNPPYIPLDEYVSLEKDVKDYEPKHALTSGVSGLEVIDAVLLFAQKYLKNNGLLLIEHGYNQNIVVQKRAKDLLSQEFECSSLKDYAGNWRIFKALRKMNKLN